MTAEMHGSTANAPAVELAQRDCRRAFRLHVNALRLDRGSIRQPGLQPAGLTARGAVRYGNHHTATARPGRFPPGHSACGIKSESVRLQR